MARVDPGPAVSSVALFRAALGVLALLVALIGAVLVYEWLSRPDVFPVRAVRFEAEFRNVDRERLAAAVAGAVQGNFLRLDLDAVKARAESVPWVHQAEVRRRWPRDLAIRIHEQQLVARWNDYRDVGGRATPGAVAAGDAWVNDAMQAVQVEGGTVPDNLPWLEGPVGTQALVFERYHAFGRHLAGAGLHIRRLALTSRRTWQIELTNGMHVVLGRTQPDRKLERFAHAYVRTLAPHVATIRAVDLRYTNGFAVETVGGRAAARGIKSGNTSPGRDVPRTHEAQEG
jgi:cell division protein FtsQ